MTLLQLTERHLDIKKNLGAIFFLSELLKMVEDKRLITAIELNNKVLNLIETQSSLAEIEKASSELENYMKHEVIAARVLENQN